jgi:hypothetical protein
MAPLIDQSPLCIFSVSSQDHTIMRNQVIPSVEPALVALGVPVEAYDDLSHITLEDLLSDTPMPLFAVTQDDTCADLF